MENSEALNKAADGIERGGWWDGGEDIPIDGGCASNMIRRATGEVGHPAQCAFARYLGGFAVWHIFDWNDAPERTQAEVIEALRAAALIESARESQVAAEATYAENLAVSA